ncbi:PAS domain-containing protein [Eubacteriaceae bacterium ES3]|nr:PAS domain-containing protein [Eubacteriaceae bacterium ES3]
MKNYDVKDYIPMVNFLAKVLGPNTEIVLHDLRNYEESIIAIENGHISGRKVGGPVTDLVLGIVKNREYDDSDYVANYTGKTKSGNLLKSSSFFIKDAQGSIIGMLCINTNISVYMELQKQLGELINYGMDQKLVSGDNNENAVAAIEENFSESVEDITLGSIEAVLADYDIPPERMSSDEKMEIVKKLFDKGIFLIKGEVSRVAEYLKVSDATLYRYLHKIK